MTNMLDITEASRRFHLDEEVIPETTVNVKLTLTVPFHNHGRAITRSSNGQWFSAFISNRGMEDASFLCLSVSERPESVGGDFNAPIMLVTADNPWWQSLLGKSVGGIQNVCLLADQNDTLHVLYGDEGGIHHTTADASGDAPYERLCDGEAWTMPQEVANRSALGDAVFLPDGSLAVYGMREGTLFEQVLGGDAADICQDVEHPSVFVGGDGRHVAFERDRRIFYIASQDGRTWADTKGNPGEEMVAHFCSSWPSIAMTGNGKLLIAYQGEGKVDLQRFPEIYGRMRPGGGSTVSYAVHADGGWRVHDFLRSSEILLKRRVSSSLPAVGNKGSFVSRMEEFWRPSLAVDKHGVVWMFYLNTTRRHIYFTRFHGETFGDRYEAQGAYDRPSRVYFVQKDSCGQPAIGLMTQAANQLYFDSLEVPEYTSAEPRRVVFLDNLEIDEMVGVESQLGQWEKQPGPLTMEGEVEDPKDRHIAWCDVRKTDTGFEMDYMGQGKLRYNWMPGRAASEDGLHWRIEKPFDMSRLTLDGMPFPSSFWRPVYLEDPEEKDPKRRFKGLLGCYRHAHGMELRTWDVVASPDGLAWHLVEGLEPVVVGDISVRYHLLRDDEDRDPNRRYKMMALMGAHAGRAVTVYTSPDLLHWHRTVWLREDPDSLVSPVSPYCTGPLALDPDAAESPWEEENHDAVLWRENGLLMMHYDAFYFHYNQHAQKALALSRDGRHYWRIKRGEVNLPHGNCGEWDSGRDRSSLPLRVGDELWMYYCGMPASCFADPEAEDYLTSKHTAWNKPDYAWELRPWGLGLAKLRVDGWGYVQREREAQRGYITTIPFKYAGAGLVVNGSGLDGVQVEIRTADNAAAVEGFEAENSRFSEQDSVTARAAWREERPLIFGNYRLRFTFHTIEAKLYSFGFAFGCE